MMNGNLLTVMHTDANHAGSKAQNDIRNILNNEGFSNVYLDGEQSKWEKRLFFKTNLKNKISNLDKENPFVVQYPFYMGRLADHEIVKNITENFINSVVIIHDLISLRTEQNEQDIKKEIDKINNFKYVVAHNQEMKKWLIENGCRSEILDLELFDYLSSKCDVEKQGDRNRVFFAGNLGKSNFIYNEIIDSKYHVYGINKKDVAVGFTYEGVVTPEQLAVNLSKENGFGLVWDGADIDFSDQYTKYNNPHKASLYLASGMPIVIWNQSALATFVIKNKVGIVVNSLSEVNQELEKLSVDDYNEMLTNVQIMRNKVLDGGFTKGVLNKLKKATLKDVIH
ncbi:hypothetical protein INH01_02505 [Latilactobacillus sakei]|nr:hypothetical protein INH01_02505 [Latilactobacillus sakei]